jgi:hypothetical protein
MSAREGDDYLEYKDVYFFGGASPNVDEEDDLAYFESTLYDKPEEEPQSCFYYGKPPPPKPPIERIKAALEIKQFSAEPGTTEYLRQMVQDRASCVYCMFETHDRFELRQHLSNHSEVRSYVAWHDRAVSDWQRMQEQKKTLKQEITSFRREIDRLDALVKKADAAVPQLDLQDGICPICSEFHDDDYALERHFESHEQVMAARERMRVLQARKEWLELRLESRRARRS